MMFPFLQKLFETTGFIPLSHCYQGQAGVLEINVAGDALIALTYFLVPAVLYVLTQRRKIFVHKYILIVFSIFIWLCALRHVIDIVTVWYPVYYLQGFFKLLTGLMAIITMGVFYRSYPKALGLDKADALKHANNRLLEEIAERERAQVALRQANEALESRVQQRTSQLIKTNRELEKEIEQRKKTEQDLLEKNKELTRINSELDNFVFHASHDLKDPIVKIEGLVTALKEELPPHSPHVREIFQHLDGSLLRVDQTVLDLTEVGRFQKSDDAENYKQITFEEICTEARAELESQLSQASAKVITNFKVPGIYFAPQKLKRILVNLLNNALYTRKPDQPLEIAISTEQAGEHILLRISDNGKGVNIPPEEDDAEVAFNPEMSNGEGLGLAYYIVKRIVTNCNGQIYLDSAPGLGSTFEVLLPVDAYQQR